MAKKVKTKEEELESIKACANDTSTKINDEGKFGRVLTGCLLQDLLAGGKKGIFGHPYGTIINFIGAPSSGKTLIGHEIGACEFHRHKKKMDYCPVDCEEGDSFDVKEVYNVDAKPPKIKPETIEDFDGFYQNWLMRRKPEKPSICILDSLDALTSNQMQDRADKRRKLYAKEEGVKKEDGSFKMDKAKFISSEFLPRACNEIAKKKSLLIIISQVRSNTEMFSYEKFTVAGGMAMPFYCHFRAVLQQTEIIYRTTKDKIAGRASGFIMNMETIKSKSARPKRKINLIGFFDWGIDDIATSLFYLYDLYTDQNKSIKNLSVTWESIDYKTVWDCRNAIAENDEWQELLEERTIEKWEKAEYDCMKLSPARAKGKGKYGK